MESKEKFSKSGLHNIGRSTLSEPKTIISQGYFWIYDPTHPKQNKGYVKRAILNLEKSLGRPLCKDELAHHIDGNRLNDDPTNLLPVTKKRHYAIHHLLLTKEDRKNDHTKKAKRLCGNDVLVIREMRKNGEKMQGIADHFGVGRTAIHDVLNGHCWSYIK